MKNKFFITVFAIIAVVVAGFFIWRGNVPSGQSGSDLNDFAKCLTAKGGIMYGTDSCSWCQKQKEDFGDSWRFIDYFNCTDDPQKCVAEDIQYTPTWIFTGGKKLVGYQTLEKLSQESGCLLPEAVK